VKFTELIRDWYRRATEPLRGNGRLKTTKTDKLGRRGEVNSHLVGVGP